MIRGNLKTMNIEDAAEKAVEDCIRLGILKEFLQKHKAKVMKMNILYEYDEKRQRQLDRADGFDEGFQEGKSQGRKEGREEGREEGRKEGRKEGRAEERLNTERERDRADKAEKRVAELEALLGKAASDSLN